MDFQQLFPHPSRPNDPILVEWTRGYGAARIFYRNRLIGEINDYKLLRKGISIQDDQLGKVEIKLLTDPFALELRVDGLHSPINRNHPKFNLSQSGVNFILPFVLSILFAWAFLSGPNPDYKDLRQTDIITGIGFAFSAALYLSSIVLLAYRKTIGFFIGSGLFLLHYLILIALALQPGMRLNTLGWIVLILLTIQLIFTGFGLKRIIDFMRYNKLRSSEKELLDDVRS